MDAWGPTNVIYQSLMQQEVCRVHAAAWGICVTELWAKGSETVSGVRGLEQLWLQGHTGWDGITVARTAPSPEQAPAKGTEQPEGSIRLSQGRRQDRIEAEPHFEGSPLLCPLRGFVHL